jgi:thiol-disulfide isomerase/thioredoxin
MHVLFAALALHASPCVDEVSIGSTVGDLAFVDTRHLPRTLAELGEPAATVLVFTTVDCPLVQRYLPRLAELERTLRPRGVQFVAVNVGRGDTLVEAARQALVATCEFPFVKDFEGDVAAAVGATRTPEVVVLDRERRLVYRGRIDAQHRLAGSQPGEVRADLARAIEDVLAGRAVELAETAVDGCVIEDQSPAAQYAHLANLRAQPPTTELSWARDIAPIVQRACQDCHRPNAVAPFALIEHRDLARRASTLAESVREGRMPPWYASAAHGEFVNTPKITDDERDMLVAWALAGAPLGDASAAPPPRTFDTSTWRIGEPDLVVTQGLATTIPADGVIPYRYVMLPHVFLADTWVDAVQITSDQPRVVHHANLAHVTLTKGFEPDDFITGFVPGGDPLVCDPGTAVCIPKGSVLGLQVHFVTVGEPLDVKLSVALRFPRGPVERELRHFQINDRRFAIPPLPPAHQVRAARVFERAATGVGMFCHMHLRGRDMTFTATYPDERRETLLCVPNYDFDWQQSYRWASGAQRFAAGTRVDVVAHFDNSPFNPFNPDPRATVRNGEQTTDEMMYGFLFFTYDDERLGLVIDPATGRVVR